MWIEFDYKDKQYKIRVEYVEPKWYEKLFKLRTKNDYYIRIEEISKTGNKVFLSDKFSDIDLVFAMNDSFNQTLKSIMYENDEDYKRYMIMTGKRILSKKERLSRMVKM